MGSKLRLNAKRLSEKEQIDLAIKLSLQQQKQQPATEQQPSGGLRPVAISNEQPFVAPGPSNTSAAQPVDEARKRRVAATRRMYVIEEGDDEGSQGSGDNCQQQADDYEPDLSDSDMTDPEDDSDFAGEESDDDGPRKKRKCEAPKRKRPSAKAPAPGKKAGPGIKASGPAAARGSKPPSSASTTAGPGARGRKPDTAPPHTPAAPVVRAPVGKPTSVPGPAPCTTGQGAASRPVQQEDAPCDLRNGGNLGNVKGAPPDHGPGASPVEIGSPTARQIHGGGCLSGQHLCEEPGLRVAMEAKTAVIKPMQPKVTEPKAKGIAAAPPQVAFTTAPPLGKPSCARGSAQATPSAGKQPPKALTLTNRATSGAALGSAAFKPPIGASGGASGIKASTPLSAGALPYRVPGLRRPGGTSATKKPSSTTS